MKILGIEGSPRQNGNTEKLVRQVLAGAKAAAGQTQFLKLVDLTIHHCQGCTSCRTTGNCVIQDDMDRVIDAIQESEAIVLGSPIYVWQVSGIIKVFMDRLCRLLTPSYESRLNGPKKIAFAYTQGNPDPSRFKSYFDYQEQVYPLLGFTVSGRVLAAGTRDKQDIAAQDQTLAKAYALGRDLVAEKV
jgi:multimeric flavodoxin WrbA